MEFGYRNDFQIELEWLPEPPEGKEEAERKTWAQMRIWVRNRLLTTNIDETSRYSEWIYWSALPLAEWLVKNWNELIFQEQLPVYSKAETGFEFDREMDERIQILSDKYADETASYRQNWWIKHNIRGVCGGGTFPNVFFWRHGYLVNVSWEPDQEPYALSNIVFNFSPGKAVVKASVLAFALRGFLMEVVSRLQQTATEHVRTRAIAETITKFDYEGARLAALRFRSGLTLENFASLLRISHQELNDFESARCIPAEIWRRIRTVFYLGSEGESLSYNEIHNNQTVLNLFSSLNPSISSEDISKILNLVSRAKENNRNPNRLIELRSDCLQFLSSDGAYVPYLKGYDLARFVRERLEMEPDEPIQEPEQIVEGIIENPIGACALRDDIESISIWDRDLGPEISLNPNSPSSSTSWGRRMAAAHEFCHLLIHSGPDRPLGIASGVWAPQYFEKTANAFAAEFLLPAKGLEAAIESRGNPATDENFNWIMSTFKVGAITAARQLSNQHFISEQQADHLMTNYSQFAP